MKKLTRPREDRIITGVCAGIAHYYDVDPTIIRLAYIAFTILTMLWAGILIYLIATIIIPEEKKK